MRNVAAVAFTPAPTSDSPNLKSSSDGSAVATFHNLIDVCFSSIRRWNPDTTLVLVTTTDPGPVLKSRLANLRAEVLTTEFAHRPPEGFYPSFNASLFSIDAFHALSDRFDRDDRIVLLDPDVVCTRSLNNMFDEIPLNGFLAYDTNFSAEHVSQGLTAAEAGHLHAQLDPELDSIPRHYGGELYGFRRDSWTAIADKVEDAWSFSLQQWADGRPRFVTEEHLLNYALRHITVRSAEDFIRRIWTAPTFRTVKAPDFELPFWHLPAEKHRGLSALHKQASNSESWFWRASPEVWQRRAGNEFGIPRRSAPRWCRDTASRGARQIQKKLALHRSGSST